MTETTTPDDDEPINTIENCRTHPTNGRVIIPESEYPVGTVLDVVINAPRDSVALMDAEVKRVGDYESAINIPHKKYDIYDIEPGQRVDVEVSEVIQRVE